MSDRRVRALIESATLKTFTLPGISACINRKSLLYVDHLAADKVVAKVEQAVFLHSPTRSPSPRQERVKRPLSFGNIPK